MYFLQAKMTEPKTRLEFFSFSNPNCDAWNIIFSEGYNPKKYNSILLGATRALKMATNY